MGSGLKVNFKKSCLYGINVEASFLNAALNFLCCKCGDLPLFYLGLPIGANPRRAATLQLVTDSMRKRLSRWKDRHLSLGGRIVLIQPVLSGIPLYYLSFSCLPRLVLKNLIRIQRSFLWGGCARRKPFSLVKWEKVCSPKRKVD